MQRPTPKIIFGGTAMAMILMLVMVTTVSAVNGSGPRTAVFAAPVTVSETPTVSPLEAGGGGPADPALDASQAQAVQDLSGGNPTPTLAPTLSPWGGDTQPIQPAPPSRQPAAPASSRPPAQPGQPSLPIIQSQDQSRPLSGDVPVIQPRFITPTPPPFFNNLPKFITSVSDGSNDVVRGVFVKNYMAMPAVEQPADDSNWVSSDDNEITLFRAAIEHGTVGLLAHNTHGGRVFDELKNGTTITLVYGDQSTKNYKVVGQLRYQALTPLDPTGDLVDLSNNARVTAGDVFAKVYSGIYPVVLQTCIEKNGDSQWGRLFILAEPA